ncbi:spore germination protein [Aneurinibacillus aneurinilyticus]|nr:spore germination protein [Aneurinibacillus aneurinilyticus]
MGTFRKWIRGRQAFRTQAQANQILNDTISASVSVNAQQISRLFSEIPQLVTRTLVLKTGQKALLVYMEGLVDKTVIHRDIIRPLLEQTRNPEEAWEDIVSAGQVKKVQQWKEIEQALLTGKSILFIDRERSALELETQGWPQRAIQEPQAETSLKNAHLGFIESASQNIALIRRYIPSRELKIKQFTIGERGGVTVSLLYLADVVNSQLIQELENRIQLIDVDTIISTGELEGFIEDNPYTPFPQFAITERPDTTASHLLQGRAVLIVDRLPGALVGPMNFVSFFQTVDDYSVRWFVGSFVRLLRFAGFFIAIFTPSLYIAMISFHYEVIPLQLLLSVGESRERVPFPPIIEAFVMELVLEMLREAGVRLPAPIGQTIGIVGGIVIGQAAVKAGIVSNIMVIVVAVTAISSFIIPNIEMSAGVRLLRFPMMLMAFTFGMVGIIIGMMVIVIHLLTLESLGNPYGSPISPLRISDMKDTFIRLPVWLMKKRPVSVGPRQLRRQGSTKKRGDDE